MVTNNTIRTLSASQGTERALAGDAMRTAVLTEMPFREAAAAWLETRKPYIGPRTYQDYTDYIKILSVFFESIRLPEIDADPHQGLSEDAHGTRWRVLHQSRMRRDPANVEAHWALE